MWAAGDATSFPVKQGGLAAQQADAVAESIAARAGAPVRPQPFRPVLRGVLLTGRGKAWLRGPHDDDPGAAERRALFWPPTKIAGRYLSPYLLALETPRRSVKPPSRMGNRSTWTWNATSPLPPTRSAPLAGTEPALARRRERWRRILSCGVVRPKRMMCAHPERDTVVRSRSPGVAHASPEQAVIVRAQVVPDADPRSAQFVMVLDSSVMNVAISQIVEDLDTTIQGVQTAITLYTLVMAAFMLLGAKLGDIIGRNRAFAIGLAIYGVGSLTTALSPNLAVLLVGWSGVEGFGAVLVVPAIAALTAATYEGQERALAYALLGGIAAIAVAAGPLIGGWVTTEFSGATCSPPRRWS